MAKSYKNITEQLEDLGYLILEDIYSVEELKELIKLLESKTLKEQFGVREFLLDNLDVASKVFSNKLKEIIRQLSSKDAISIKSIYFDKPPSANWIVNWHQDLTINLTGRKEVKNYKNWRVKPERTVVQPNRELLENIFTIRIHLDDCTNQNGALRVIEKSHSRGVIEIKEWIKQQEGEEKICEVGAAGILIMKPLILHSSKRTENDNSRRVIHIEFTDMELPAGLEWKEKLEI